MGDDNDMVARRNKVAPCGNYCAECPDFRVFVENDDALRRQVASDLTKEVGRDILPEEVGCEGCWGAIHSYFAASLKCEIRQCVETKGFATCAECDDYPCAVFSSQFADDSKCANNIRAIKKIGLDTWIDSTEGPASHST